MTSDGKETSDLFQVLFVYFLPKRGEHAPSHFHITLICHLSKRWHEQRLK